LKHKKERWPSDCESVNHSVLGVRGREKEKGKKSTVSYLLAGKKKKTGNGQTWKKACDASCASLPAEEKEEKGEFLDSPPREERREEGGEYKKEGFLPRARKKEKREKKRRAIYISAPPSEEKEKIPRL